MIDILIATFNGEAYIREQLNSILSQTFTDWRVIAHDDGSTDATVDIVKDFCSLYPDKFKLIEDGFVFGSAKENFSFLLENSSAEYIMFCDQDDVWLPSKIERTLNKMKELVKKSNENTPVVVHSDLMIVDVDLNVISESMFDFQRLPYKSGTLLEVLAKCSVTGCTMMINKAAKNVSLPIGYDAIMHDWWVVARSIQSGGKVEFIDVPLLLYRQHDNNSVGAQKNSYMSVLSRIFSIRATYLSFLKGWKQANAIDPKIKFFVFVFMKMYLYIGNLYKRK